MATICVYNISTGWRGYQNGIDGWHPGCNSAGGVSVMFSFKNTTGKAIKYAGFYFTPYNNVGDVQSCQIRQVSTDGVKFTGPLEPGTFQKDSLFENAWYNNSITSVKLEKVSIIYMDGTGETLSGSQIDTNKPDDAGPCYIATAVYGSYDCPQVWTLRRFRDDTLAASWHGRAFIHIYYAVSPILVKFFGKSDWFLSFWRPRLDAIVEKLRRGGVDASPYHDKDW